MEVSAFPVCPLVKTKLLMSCNITVRAKRFEVSIMIVCIFMYPVLEKGSLSVVLQGTKT